MIQISVQYLGEKCEIHLNTKDPESPARIVYSSNPRIVSAVRSITSRSYGRFGHIVGDYTSAIDLYSAIFSEENKILLKPVLVKGRDIISRWSSPLDKTLIS